MASPSRVRRRPLRLYVGIAASATRLLVASGAAASPAPSGATPSPHAASEVEAAAPEIIVTRALAAKLGSERGPDVRQAEAPVRASASIHDAAGGLVPYAPRLTVFAGHRAGDLGSGLEIGGNVTQDLSLHGLGGARRASADAVERSSRHGLERARLEGATVAVLAWLDVLEAQALVALRERARVDAEEIARVAEARVARGVGMPIEASLAGAEVGAAILGERDAEGMLVEARAALKFALGLPPTPDVVAAGEIELDDVLAPAANVRHGHPAETAARSSVALAQADTKLAHAQASPPLGVGVSYTREGTGEQIVTGTLTVPLPVLDPARFDAARQHANVLGAEAHVTRVRDELARDLQTSAHERVHTREVRDILRTRVLAPLRETVRLARASYQAGTQDATALLLLRQRLVAAEEQLGHAAAEVKRADVRNALARGTLLDEGAK